MKFKVLPLSQFRIQGAIFFTFDATLIDVDGIEMIKPSMMDGLKEKGGFCITHHLHFVAFCLVLL